MTSDIARARLRNQRLVAGRCATPASVVSWMGAVQAQEYVDAQWGLALRTRRSTRNAIERAMTDGTILRTHVLRPTWHFVAPPDIRWLLALTGPYVSKRMAPYNGRLELDASVFQKSQALITRALRGGVQLTRQELRTTLLRGGIDASHQRLAHIVMQAELDAVICSGPRRDGQFTYMLLDERVPPSSTRPRDAALTELARRYFTSHGPAQVHDFVWWSGLPVAEARRGLAMAESWLVRHDTNGATYWSAPATGVRAATSPSAFLLPIYDEYLIAYKDRSAALDRSRSTRATWPDSFSASVIVDGQVVGAWRRTFEASRVIVAVKPLARLSTVEASAIEDAAQAFAGFVGTTLELSFNAP